MYKYFVFYKGMYNFSNIVGSIFLKIYKLKTPKNIIRISIKKYKTNYSMFLNLKRYFLYLIFFPKTSRGNSTQIKIL